MKCYEQNNLFLYLANHLGYESALHLMKTYHVGTARKWKNATVFWQTDISGKIRTGKIMQYNAETGKRIKEPYAMFHGYIQNLIYRNSTYNNATLENISYTTAGNPLP